jgi:hypothetical protein
MKEITFQGEIPPGVPESTSNGHETLIQVVPSETKKRGERVAFYEITYLRVNDGFNCRAAVLGKSSFK